MEQKEVERLEIFQNGQNVEIKEIITTHISWVFLTDSYAYKIKKPIKKSFLDYSTLPQRKHYCEKEVMLNRRLAKEVYLKVVPVFSDSHTTAINGTKGNIVDFAVMMHKMNHRRQMDILLKEGKVTTFDIDKIAQEIADFHHNAKVIALTIDEDKLKNDFNDIRTILPFVKYHFGVSYTKAIEAACVNSNNYIAKNAGFMRERVSGGNYRDCHGDLHARNIILEKEPIIFDCIEFNDSLRHIDILNEIAFFCMELEAMGKDVLNNYFIKKYLSYAAFELDPALENLMCYYKMYKANIRAKVIALQFLEQDAHDPEEEMFMGKIKNYLEKMDTYNQNLR